MDKPKRIKFKVKPKKEDPKPKPKKPIKFKVVKKEEKKEMEAPKPKKKKINFKVVKKEVPKEEKKKKDPDRKRSELKRVTGVSRKKVKKGDTAEMAGKLPPNVQKNILKQLETITKFNIDNVSYDDLLNARGQEIYNSIDQAQENYMENLGYRFEYDQLPNISSAENRFYRENFGDLYELKGKKLGKFERIQMKIFDGTSEQVYKDFKREWKKFQAKNKGKTATLEEMAKRFNNFLDNTYF